MTGRQTIRYISPLSAFKTALVLSLAGLLAWIVCVTLLYFGMDAAGIWEKLNGVIGGAGGQQVVSYGIVLSIASLMGAILAVLMSVLAPLAAVIYNASVDLFGGLEVTLQEEVD